MDYLFIVSRSGVSGAMNDLSLNPLPIILGLASIIVFFWLLSKA